MMLKDRLVAGGNIQDRSRLVAGGNIQDRSSYQDKMNLTFTTADTSSVFITAATATHEEKRL